MDFDNVLEVFEPYAVINTKFITTKNDQGDLISLRFIDVNNRLERQTGYMDPILAEYVKDLRLAVYFFYSYQWLSDFTQHS